ncbi:MAG: phospholipase D-like domain-containing protein [Bacteroidota bacterium]|nr:phospholipase D-like domain-containing protein [Bacteroidota bacterium]
MKKFVLFVFVMIFATSSIFSQSIIINELYNSSGNDEWVELLVVQDGLDIRSWDIRDFSSTGGALAPLVFTTNALWNNLKSGTVIIIARPENTFPEDFDPSDYSLTIKSNNSTYFTGNVFSIAGTSDAVQIRNTSQTHIFGVSWGPANAASIPAPKVHFSAALTSNTATAFKGNSVSQLIDVANWSQNTLTITRGTGNTTENSAWISLLRARPEGSGSVSITPSLLDGSVDTTIKITYRKDPAFAVNNLRIIVPPEFSWSKNISDVSYTNIIATASVIGDTIYFTGISFSADSTEITISPITSATFTGYYKFKTQSGASGTYGDVAPIPVITVYGAAIPISEVKVNDANGASTRIGDLVTVRGIITVANEFGSPSFIQDNSAGMSIYGTIFSAAVNIGDEIQVTGKVTQFGGLNQIELPEQYSVISTGNFVDPVISTPTQINFNGVGGVEIYEGKLVHIIGVTVTTLSGTPVTNWAANTNYRLIGASTSDTVQLRIDNNTNLVGGVAPAGTFDLIGVVGQYKTTTPYIGGYQVMPRFTQDIISSGPLFTEYPEETYLDSSSVTVGWKTLFPGTSRVRYGVNTNYELGVIEIDNDLRISHSVALTGLTAATIYNVQAFSVSGNDTSFAGNLIVSTTSKSPTTGKINVYFSKSVNTTLSIGEAALANINLSSKVIERINNSRRSIDAALYSLSGTVGANVASALVAAKNRGVKVRVIGEYDNRTTLPWSTLTNNGITVIYDAYGLNDGTGLHHNKFFVFDYRGGAPESVWVWTGSWNATDPGTDADRQNVIEIQDVALAGAYTREFEEMWGANTETPNSGISRFGARKLNNTPHKFIIGGKYIESFFSPSDRTTTYIGKALGKTQSSINIAMLTFTRKELADSIVVKKSAGKKTRVILDNNTDSGTQFPYMQSSGVDILLKVGTGFLHHKYAIVDAEPYGGTAWVVTGSHNWSSAAETRNDENTLIIKDNRVGNLYIQEFAARYTEAGGTDPVRVSVNENGNGIPDDFNLSQNYPNPFNPTTTIAFSLPIANLVTLRVYNILGQEVATLVNEEMKAGNYTVNFNASHLASGVYFYKLTAGSFNSVKKLSLLK